MDTFEIFSHMLAVVLFIIATAFLGSVLALYNIIVGGSFILFALFLIVIFYQSMKIIGK